MIHNKNTKRLNKIIIEQLEFRYLNKQKTSVCIGDTINLGLAINENDKIRIQSYEGIVISKKGVGLAETITVRKVFQGIGVEKCFLINSPKVKSLRVIKSTKVHRSKLYYIRQLSGKDTNLEEIF